MFSFSDVGSLLAVTAGFTALVCYVMCGNVARKAPTLGGGTRVLSWIGLCVPCIAWLVLYQEWAAVKAYARPEHGPQAEGVRRSFNGWLVAYVVCTIVASVLAKTFGPIRDPG